VRTLESTWVLQTSLEPAWVRLLDVEGWPSWWSAVGSIEQLKVGDEYGVGTAYRMNNELEFHICEADEPHLLEFHTRQGLARWTLYEDEGFTFIHLSLWGCGYAEPTFAMAMAAGAQGLAKHLGVRLVEAGSWNAADE
jgi:hypothetical protein